MGDFEQGTHLADIAMLFNNYRPVDWVLGQVDELEGLAKGSGAAPDAAVATIHFDNRVRATLTVGSVGHDIPGETGTKWRIFGVDVYGSRGHLKATLNRTLTVFILATAYSRRRK